MVTFSNALFRWNIYRFKPLRPKTLVGGHRFVKNQQFLRISNKYRGRPYNCTGLSKRKVKRQLSVNTMSRQARYKALQLLWYTRIDGALYEYGMHARDFIYGLRKCNIWLDRKVLAIMAIYEPQSFKSLVHLSQKINQDEGLKNALYDAPEGVFTRQML